MILERFRVCSSQVSGKKGELPQWNGEKDEKIKLSFNDFYLQVIVIGLENGAMNYICIVLRCCM